MTLQNLLLVDDDADILSISELVLSQVDGWQVRTATSGEQALVEVRAARPSLILMDMWMPGLDGLETLAILQSDPLTARIPVILMTAAEITAPPTGAIGLIHKPFDPLTLPKQVQAYIH